MLRVQSSVFPELCELFTKFFMDYRFRWNDRLHRAHEFSTTIQKGKRWSTGGLIVWVYRHAEATAQAAAGEPRQERRGARMGLAIPRTYGNAVARNRLKRMLREVFRLHKALLPSGVDMVFSARPLSVPTVRYQTVEPLVKDLWIKAHIWSAS